MSTHRHPVVPKNLAKRIPDESLVVNGVQRLFQYACRTNDRHRTVVTLHSLEDVPGECCPSCGGELILLSAFDEGEAPAAGYDPDSAFKAILQDGYYAWKIEGNSL